MERDNDMRTNHKDNFQIDSARSNGLTLYDFRTRCRNDNISEITYKDCSSIKDNKMFVEAINNIAVDYSRFMTAGEMSTYEHLIYNQLHCITQDRQHINENGICETKSYDRLNVIVSFDRQINLYTSYLSKEPSERTPAEIKAFKDINALCEIYPLRAKNPNQKYNLKKDYVLYFTSKIFKREIDSISPEANLADLEKRYDKNKYKMNPLFRRALFIKGNEEKLKGNENNIYMQLHKALGVNIFLDTMKPPTTNELLSSIPNENDRNEQLEIVKNQGSIMLQALYLAQLGQLKKSSNTEGKYREDIANTDLNDLSLGKGQSITELFTAGARVQFNLPKKTDHNSDTLLSDILRLDKYGHISYRTSTHFIQPEERNTDGTIKNNINEVRRTGFSGKWNCAMEWISSLFGNFMRWLGFGKTISGFCAFGSKLAIGGLGKYAEDGSVICNDGTNGEMYIGAYHSGENNLNALMIGIEATSYGYKNRRGYKHTTSADSEEQSATLNFKLEQIGTNYGGRVVDLSNEDFELLADNLYILRKYYYTNFRLAMEGDEAARERLNHLIETLGKNKITKGELEQLINDARNFLEN